MIAAFANPSVRRTGGRRTEYLLDYFPRKVSVDDETLAAVPDCVRAF